jgi:hypothetical protein
VRDADSVCDGISPFLEVVVLAICAYIAEIDARIELLDGGKCGVKLVDVADR